MTVRYPNNLEQIRKRAGLTQAQLAERIGCSTQAVQNYEYGLRDMRSSVLRKLADALDVSVTSILGLDKEPWLVKAKATTCTVPVIGRIAAGDPREAIQDTGDRWYVPDPLLEGHPEAFYLVVDGDSMDRIVPEGSLVLIDPDAEVHSGEVAAVLVNGCDATLKRVYFAGNTIVLHPESHNSEHRDKTIDKTDPDAPLFKIVGKAITYTAPEGWRA